MIAAPTRVDSVTEVVVPADVTAAALTRCVDELVDAQVQQLAAMYRRLIADLEEQSRRLKKGTRDAWLTKNRPAARAGEPGAIRRRLESLPARPPANTDWTDPPEFRSEPRERGVYLRLTSGCYRNADLRAYDATGERIDRVCVVDDPIIRLGAARFLWSVLEWRDPFPESPAQRLR
jgi:hypothetical protein